MGIKTQEKLELSTSYPQKVDNFTLTITFHIDVWVNPQLAEMLIFLEIFHLCFHLSADFDFTVITDITLDFPHYHRDNVL